MGSQHCLSPKTETTEDACSTLDSCSQIYKPLKTHRPTLINNGLEKRATNPTLLFLWQLGLPPRRWCPGPALPSPRAHKQLSAWQLLLPSQPLPFKAVSFLALPDQLLLSGHLLRDHPCVPSWEKPKQHVEQVLT